MDFKQLKSYFPRLDSNVTKGIAIGIALSPIFGPILSVFVPFVSLLAAVLAVLAAYAMLGPLKLKPRDFIFTAKAAVLKLTLGYCARRRILTDDYWYSVYDRVGRHRPMMYFIDEKLSYSYGDMENDSNRFGRLALQLGLKPGDTIALFMQNRPQYVAAWLGFAKVGIRTALINHNLKDAALLHSIKEAACKLIVFEAVLAPQVETVRSQLEPALAAALYAYGKADAIPWAKGLDALLQAVSEKPIDEQQRAANVGVQFGDPVLYVYTSGTTGLPKAAKITHARIRMIGHGFRTMCNIVESDRIYTPLPLYHSAGGILGVGMVLEAGCFMVLRRKFSASHMASDIRQHGCTVLQYETRMQPLVLSRIDNRFLFQRYIGEMCRFALAAAVHDEDRTSGIRVAIGNGLRADIWQQFQERFGIGRICEFYGATEGAGALINIDGRVGAVGFYSVLVDPFQKVRVVKRNDETGELVRGADGRCVQCVVDEPGELLFEVQSQGGVRNFDGYQAEGFVYFVDRIGDTFRWKGENCSTAEVANAITSSGMVTGDVNVYGVAVPKADGKAGAAAIALDPKSLDLAKLYATLSNKLPPYAVPVFLRFTKELEMTSTFKQVKTNYVKQGIDISAFGDDQLYVADAAKKTYVPVDAALHAKIMNGELRL